MSGTSLRAGERREGPPFAEPWQAQAFALAVQLADAGHFSWGEWTETLAGVIAAARERGDDDEGGARYYERWLEALEQLVVAKGLAGRRELDALRHAWAEAYQRTPHGTPVALDADEV